MPNELLPCPFCGGAVSECDESPLYGGSIMHDETECLFKNNLLFHRNVAERWNTRPIEDALQARIAELEAEVANLNDWLTTWKESLNIAQAEIAKLKANAITWHRYPDEKPEPSHEYEVNIPVMIATLDPISQSDFADYNIESENFWRYGTKYKGITHWAYLPAPPKEGE